MPKRNDTNAVPTPDSTQPVQNSGLPASWSVSPTMPVASEAISAAIATNLTLATSFAARLCSNAAASSVRAKAVVDSKYMTV